MRASSCVSEEPHGRSPPAIGMDNDDASMLRAAAEERRLRSSFVESARMPPAPPADDAFAELSTHPR